MQVKCKHCNTDVEPVITEQSIHRRADCPICGRWIKWIAKHVDREVNKELLDNVKDNIKKIWQQKS